MKPRPIEEKIVATQQKPVSRRDVLRWGTGAAIMGAPLSRQLLYAQPLRGAAHIRVALNDRWAVRRADAPIEAEQAVTLPHTPVKLSWQKWEPDQWQRLWRYRRSFHSPLQRGERHRVFLRFEGVMSGAKISLNGRHLGEYLGGFLPFEYEITELLRDRNEMEVIVDGGWLDVPPSGSPKGPRQLDYLLPAGIHREVCLRVLPEIFLDDVFAKPVDVLNPGRRLEIQCSVNASRTVAGPLRLEARLLDGETTAGVAVTEVRVEHAGCFDVSFTMSGLENVQLWSTDSPRLYTLRLSLRHPTIDTHEYVTRVGFREARFTASGFFLNGKKTRIFGLNRHELFPFTGFAMPDRVMRRDAEILKREFHCNTVRCSHYPQTEAFLDACDELGLMVWEEVPGWQYIGDDPWKALLMRDLRSMILRDRNHPSIIVWGVRVNESANNPPLYTRTAALAKSLDDSRQTSGTMTHCSTDNWSQDVFAYDDYHAAPDGSVAMHKPLPDVPFFFAEGIGQFAYEHGGEFKQYYRRAGARDVQEGQPKYHAQGHDRANSDPHCGGLIAWCAFDYASLLNGYKAIKCPGIADTFRIPKLGAAFYKSQVAPTVEPVIEPGFYWDFSDGQGPGNKAHIFSNCDRLAIRVGSRLPVIVLPDRDGYPNLAYPPFVVDLSAFTTAGEDLTVEGYVGQTSMQVRNFSSDRSRDKLLLRSDDGAIANDAQDATRVWFAVCDRYGSIVPHLEGEVEIAIKGPGEIIGDLSFPLAETGGVGAVWVRSKPGGRGVITIHARHPRFDVQRIDIQTTPA